MKKIIFITTISVLLTYWNNIGCALDKWYEGIVTDITETTITVDHHTYNIGPKTVIEDTWGHKLSIDALGQKSCCNNIRFLVGEDGYIEKIIVDTTKVVR